jgi:gliding motility-associated-like protein
VRVAGQWLSGAGSFDLIAHSATSCDTLFSVKIVEIPDMPIPPNPGDQLILTNQGLLLNSNADPAMWKVRWQPSDLFSCDTCLKTMLHALKDTTLEVTYSHRFGCGEYSYPFRVILAQHSDFFIPNVFSPNGDGRNDFWTVSPPKDVPAFEEVSIWDRWGSLLARWHDAPEIRWDGLFRGQALNPGVFVYYIRYTNAKGEKVEKKGDVSIVR